MKSTDPERSDHDFDVAIIGGGVNGTGILRDCALRGLRVVLLEKRDICAGTTGACSGMIHGGLRYLKDDYPTTKLSCRDSGYIQRIAPHLIFRIPFLFPLLSDDPNQAVFMEFLETYLEAYDSLSPMKGGMPHRRLKRGEVLELEPRISGKVRGAITFDEWGIDPFRLCFLNALSSREKGAVIMNSFRVEGLILEKGRVNGLYGRDRDGRKREIRARVTVNAAGPWTPHVCSMAGVQIRLRPGKGVHIIYPRRLTNVAILSRAIDGRQVFLMPHLNSTILGTTDDDYYGNLDFIIPLFDEVEYLLEGMERTFPSIRRYGFARVMAGVRCTLYEYGKPEDSLSRDFEIFDHETRDSLPGLISLGGGKFAAFRHMAEKVTDRICEKLGISEGCTTHLLPLPGGEETLDPFDLSRSFKIPLHTLLRLLSRHGTRAPGILEEMRVNPELKRHICLCEPITEGELRYSIRSEMVNSLSDLRRRIRLGCGPCQGLRCAARAAVVFGEERGLSHEEVDFELLSFFRERWKGRALAFRGEEAARQELFLTHLFTGHPLSIGGFRGRSKDTG